MEYDINLIDSIDFESIDIPDFTVFSKEGSSFRISEGDKRGMPPYDLDIVYLRGRLVELYELKIKNYDRLEANCDIKRDTFQRALKFRNGKNITYSLLSKFSVGAGLSVAEASELFKLLGRPLNERNRYDYILLCELRNGCSIDEYNADLKEYGYPGIFSKAD